MALQRFDASIGSPSILQVDGFDSSLVLKHGDKLKIRVGSAQPNNPIKLSECSSSPGSTNTRWARVGDYLPSLKQTIYSNQLESGLIVRRVNAEQDIEVLTFPQSQLQTARE